MSENRVSVHEPLPDSLWIIQGDSLLQLFHRWENSDNKWEQRSAKKIYDQAKAYQEANYPDQLVPLIMSQLQPGNKYLDSATSVWHIWQTRDPDFGRTEAEANALREVEKGREDFKITIRELKQNFQWLCTATADGWYGETFTVDARTGEVNHLEQWRRID